MNIRKQDIKNLLCACIMLVTLLIGPQLHAQVPYMEGIGGTDVELMAFLNNLPEGQTVTRDKDHIRVTSPNLTVEYVLRRGKVISIEFDQQFANQKEAIDAYNRSMSFLYGRGVPLRQVRNMDTCRVVRGYGGGVEADLTVRPVKNKYRMDADLLVIN